MVVVVVVLVVVVVVDVLVVEDVAGLVVVVAPVVVGTRVVVVDDVVVDVDPRPLVPAGDPAVREGEPLGPSHPTATRTTATIGAVTNLVNRSATRDPTAAVCQRPTASGRSAPSGRRCSVAHCADVVTPRRARIADGYQP